MYDTYTLRFLSLKTAGQSLFISSMERPVIFDIRDGSSPSAFGILNVKTETPILFLKE